MTEEQLEKGRLLNHEIERLESEIESIENYNGNKTFMAFGQDARHCSSIKTDNSLYNDVMLVILRYKGKELTKLKAEFKKL